MDTHRIHSRKISFKWPWPDLVKWRQGPMGLGTKHIKNVNVDLIILKLIAVT